MQLSRPPIQPIAPAILDALPNPPLPEAVCPRRTRQQLDLMLLAIEALDLGGAEAMLTAAKELDLQSVIKNRVSFWRLRATNPLRRYSQRRPLTLNEAKALVFMTCHLARRMTVLIRQMLLVYDQLLEKQLPLEQHIRLGSYLERFRAHFRSRMNPKRTAVIAYNSDEKLNQLAMSLLGQLLFCTGTSGAQRFWSSLFDGEAS
ncbi:MAG: DUF3038 domain-containing protein [Timaviella obliquedivisa GSE-PSE-MK23-08B]|nr:DUF3038 domain-containing protein [Timaviella obliquedivisa GSE-PSE-MK23-08B]